MEGQFVLKYRGRTNLKLHVYFVIYMTLRGLIYYVQMYIFYSFEQLYALCPDIRVIPVIMKPEGKTVVQTLPIQCNHYFGSLVPG